MSSELGVPSDTTEFNSKSGTIKKQAKALADAIRASKKVVFFTGAGVSTAAKIPDFRGPQGVWTLRDQGKRAKMDITMEQALPTRTHMALVELQNKGIMTYLVSQNVDGLHRRSGIRADMISELHGNCYIETCNSCNKEFLRDFDVCDRRGKECKRNARNKNSHIGHCTGRLCDVCNTGSSNGSTSTSSSSSTTSPSGTGCLEDSIIHFSETLPVEALRRADEACANADIVICLGSSMTVMPACGLPKKCIKKGGQMVIVNLQKTKYDEYCKLRIFGKTDEVMELVMKELGLEIPKFHLTKNVVIGNTAVDKGNNHWQWTMFVAGECGTPLPFMDKVEFELHPTFSPNKIELEEQPFTFTRVGWGTFDVKITLHFVEMDGVQEKTMEYVHTLKFDNQVHSKVVPIRLS